MPPVEEKLEESRAAAPNKFRAYGRKKTGTGRCCQGDGQARPQMKNTSGRRLHSESGPPPDSITYFAFTAAIFALLVALVQWISMVAEQSRVLRS